MFFAVVSTVMSGILFARFPIVDYVTDQGKKRRGWGKPKALIVVKIMVHLPNGDLNI